MAKKKKTFDAGAAVRALARERIGQPKPTAILKDKRGRARVRDAEREIRQYTSR